MSGRNGEKNIWKNLFVATRLNVARYAGQIAAEMDYLHNSIYKYSRLRARVTGVTL